MNRTDNRIDRESVWFVLIVDWGGTFEIWLEHETNGHYKSVALACGPTVSLKHFSVHMLRHLFFWVSTKIYSVLFVIQNVIAIEYHNSFNGFHFILIKSLLRLHFISFKNFN